MNFFCFSFRKVISNFITRSLRYLNLLLRISCRLSHFTGVVDAISCGEGMRLKPIESRQPKELPEGNHWIPKIAVHFNIYHRMWIYHRYFPRFFPKTSIWFKKISGSFIECNREGERKLDGEMNPPNYL